MVHIFAVSRKYLTIAAIIIIIIILSEINIGMENSRSNERESFVSQYLCAPPLLGIVHETGCNFVEFKQKKCVSPAEERGATDGFFGMC